MTKNMDRQKFRFKYRIAIFGLLGGLTFALLCLIISFVDGGLIFPLLYIPGAIFGLAMKIALKEHSGNSSLLFIFSTIEYLTMIFFCSKDIEYLAIRRILMGGLGAILFLTTIRFFTTIKLDLNDFIAGFVIGIATTIFMWTDNFEFFDPWLMIVSIILWQTLISAIINRRLLILETKTY